MHLERALGIAGQLRGDLIGEFGVDAAGDVQLGELGPLGLGRATQLAPLDLDLGQGELRLRSHRDVLPAAIENDPATSPARPASTTVDGDARPPATPAISPRFDTRPSMAPNTAGRSHPPVTSRWR